MGGNGQRVAIGLSGGVDSAVAAACLVEKGYDVLGLTLRLQTGTDDSDEPDEIRQARYVARRLSIEHRVIDLRDAFDRLVLLPAWKEYARGRTPNPCAVCNEYIKFGLLFEHAKQLGADRIASGHHCRIEKFSGKPAIYRGNDPKKDQTYFLFRLSSERLHDLLFPIGDFTKDEVRLRARNAELTDPETRESQDTCLALGTEGFAETLRQRFGGEMPPGPIVDDRGTPVGEHRGLHNYTVGQRRGHGVALGQRAFIECIDTRNNRLVVTTDPTRLASGGCRVSKVNWQAETPSGELSCMVQIRYRQKAVPCRVIPGSDGDAEVRFDTPVGSVTPGQAAVFYDKDRLLGGGWIDERLPLSP